MKKLIVPIDFSDLSHRAIDFAIKLSKHFPGEIQMVYVQKTSADLCPTSTIEVYEKADQKFKELVSQYKTQIPAETELSYVIRRGSIFKEVISLTKREDSFIVLSTHGASGYESLFLGSNAFKIISYAECPVFTVGGSFHTEKIERIVMPLDVSFESRQKVPITAEIAKKYGAEVHIVTVSSSHVWDIRQRLHSYTDIVSNYFKRNSIPHKTELLIGHNIADITLEYSKKIKADLISIMSEQEKQLNNHFLGTYAHQMVNKAEVPVMAISALHPDQHDKEVIWW